MTLIRSFTWALLITAVPAVAVSAEAQIILQIESPLPAEAAGSQSMLIFKNEVARLSGGSIEVVVAADSPSGLKETIDAVHGGRAFATWLAASNFSRLVPEIEAVSLPFVFDNYDQARRAVAGPVGSLIAKKLDSKGFTVLAWMDLGGFYISNSKRPLKTVDDFKGLNIRVLANATHLATFQALGARPVAMDLKDVEAALRQRDIDGLETEYSVLLARKLYESQKYLSDIAPFLDFYILVANKKTFASLDPMQQQAIREAAAITSFRERQMSAETEAAALVRLRDAGMQFDPSPPEIRVALRQTTAGVIGDVKKWIGVDIVNQVLVVKDAAAAGGHGHR